MADLKFCLVELSASAETDLTGPGTWDSIAGTFTLDSKSDSDFELAGAGCKVTYNGTSPATVVADAAVSVNATATGEIGIGFAVDGTQEQEHVHTKPGNTNITPETLPTLLDVAPGETIELVMINSADATNATAEHVSMRLQAFTYSS
jgi:hypothetical protein